MTPTPRASVLDALAEVYDPELDEPITRLGFVASNSATVLRVTAERSSGVRSIGMPPPSRARERSNSSSMMCSVKCTAPARKFTANTTRHSKA